MARKLAGPTGEHCPDYDGLGRFWEFASQFRTKVSCRTTLRGSSLEDLAVPANPIRSGVTPSRPARARPEPSVPTSARGNHDRGRRREELQAFMVQLTLLLREVRQYMQQVVGL